MQIEFRELTSADLESLLELYVQLDKNNAELSLGPTLELWNAKIANDPTIKYFGALADGKVVATCFCALIPNLTCNGRSICFLENVVTHQDYRRQGLAKKVIDMAEEFARANNCYKIILESASYRTEAHKFYEKIGFSGQIKKGFVKYLK